MTDVSSSWTRIDARDALLVILQGDDVRAQGVAFPHAYLLLLTLRDGEQQAIAVPSLDRLRAIVTILEPAQVLVNFQDPELREIALQANSAALLRARVERAGEALH